MACFRVQLFACLTSLVGLVPPAAAQDLVHPHKGGPSRGTILEMGREQVKLDAGGVPKIIPVNEIAKITFGSEPSELNNGRTAALQKNYILALQELRKLDGATLDRDLIKHEVDFLKALCQARLALAEGGDKAAASATMLAFVNSAKQSFHFYEAAEVLGELAMVMGKYADAVKYYGPIARVTWPDYQLRANYALGRALAADKQFDQALARYEAVSNSPLATPEAARLKLLAALGKAVCLAETGKAEEGLALAQEVISKNDAKDAGLFARAYNTLGIAYLKSSKPREAVLAFLHTDLLYATEADAHAEALYYLSKNWSDTNKAAFARNTLRERYSGTVWAQ